MPAKGNKHHGYLLDDPQVNRWYERSGSQRIGNQPNFAHVTRRSLMEGSSSHQSDSVKSIYLIVRDPA